MKRNKINHPIVMADGKITDPYGSVEGIPTTHIIDRKWKPPAKHVGLTGKFYFESELRPLLKQRRPWF